MSASYTVLTATVLAQVHPTFTPQSNPLVGLGATVNGVSVGPIFVFYYGIAAANVNGGSTAVQQFLAPLLATAFNFSSLNNRVSPIPVPNLPSYPATVVADPPLPSPSGATISLPIALVGSWTQ